MFVVTENLLHATNKCNCQEQCDCEQVFEGANIYNPDSEEARRQAENNIHNSATFKARPAWHLHLSQMHEHFCDTKTCKGIPKLEEIEGRRSTIEDRS